MRVKFIFRFCFGWLGGFGLGIRVDEKEEDVKKEEEENREKKKMGRGEGGWWEEEERVGDGVVGERKG